MKRILAACAVAVVFTVAPCNGSVQQTGDSWVLESPALKVAVEMDGGRLSVLHKATGLLWQQAAGGESGAQRDQVQIHRAETPAVIDGDANEWPRDTYVWLPWVGEDGERNLSGGARLMWDETHLYLHVRVRDQNVAFGGESPVRWWEADSIEFWVDSVQVGLHLCPGQEVAADPRGAPLAGVRMAVQLIEEGRLPGYAVELAVPLEHFPVLRAPEPGVRVSFAIGLNDADPGPDEPVTRVAQGYYPRTWVHSGPTTFATAVLTDADGNAPERTPENDRTAGRTDGDVADMRPGTRPDSIAYDLTLTRGQVRPLALAVELALVDGDAAVDVGIGCPVGDSTEVRRFRYPGPLYPPEPESYFLAAADSCDGRYLPVDDPLYRNRRLVNSGNDMPWVAVTDGRQGMMLIALTPFDAFIQTQPRAGSEHGFPGLGWEPSKGTFGGSRQGRIAFFDQGGHVAACKVYRSLARKQGHFGTLTDKGRANPDVHKLMGAVNWWGARGLDFVRQAVAAGMRRGLVNGRFKPEDMAEIVRLGWLVGEYDNYVDIDDSPTIARTKAPIKEHAVVKPDGELMTAWVTRDKDMNPIHTFMKHCTAKQLECAQAIIPEVLRTYPYNTRFLDVTTAEGLKECYSDVHPTARAGDMANRRRLCRYVSEDLGLVAGGEHGRFWDVPVLHYHEGMMGGGMYGWPAGYLRDVTDRKQLGDRYLTYGINPANRAPLFELVYHDCVVNYWYWGACSDYLHQVAPEITDRKTAMNVLYGTPPMMWAHSHGLRWQVPEEREYMLMIYRTVCRLHEVIGMQEMVSHAFLTPDRMVQRTEFADGTVCTVNFGATPFPVARDAAGAEMQLGENDFYVKGPAIEQWRVTRAGTDAAPGARETVVRTADFVFIDAPDRPIEHAGLRVKGRVAIDAETPTRARLQLSRAAELELDVARWRPARQDLPRLLLTLDTLGRPASRVDQDIRPRLKLRAPQDQTAGFLLLAGPEAIVPDVTIRNLVLTSAGAPVHAGTALPQDARVRATVTIANAGLGAATGLAVALTLDGADGPELLRTELPQLPPGAERTLHTEFAAGRADGRRRIVARIAAPRQVTLTGRLQAAAPFKGPVRPESFLLRRRYVVHVPPGDAAGVAVELPFDLNVPGGGKVDPGNLRIAFESGRSSPAQFEPSVDQPERGTLVFCLPEGMPADADVEGLVLGAALGATEVYPPGRPYEATPDGARIRMGTYSAAISDGVLSSVAVLDAQGRGLPVVERIIVSSKETGWSSETGPVESFAREQLGPVRAVYACVRQLQGGFRVERRWFFYPDRVEVHSSCTPPRGCLTRVRYLREATATNETGRQAHMDGQGDAEEFGFKDTPQWYAVFSPQYRNACIALTKSSGFTYWDGGVLGQISLNHAGGGTEKRVFIWGPGTDSGRFAATAARAYTRGVTARREP